MSAKREDLNELRYYQAPQLVQSEDFDITTAMAAEIGNASIAMLHIFIDNKPHFISHYGLLDNQNSNDYLALTELVLPSKKTLVISDLSKKKDFANSPIFEGDMPIVSYAGVPILHTDGYILGVLSLIDNKVSNLNAQQISLLEKLATQAFEILVLRKNQFLLAKQNDASKVASEVLEMVNNVNGIASWVYDVPSGIFSNSSKIYEIHEVPSDYVFDVTNTLNFYHKDYHSTVIKATDDVINKGIPFDYVALLITAKGNERWVRSIGTKLGDQVIGSFQDITELKQRELKFEGIFNSNMSFVAFLDKEGILVELNETALKATAIKRSEVIGMPFWDTPVWEKGTKTQQEVQNNFKKALAGEESVYEVEIIIANGKKTTILFSLRPILNQHNEVIYVIAEGRPIDKLVQTRDRYKAILEATSPGTWEWNLETEELIFDELWVGMLGYTIAELSPFSFKTWENLVHPDDFVFATGKLQRYFDRLDEFYDVEFRMKHKKGHWLWVKSYGRVMEWSSEGKPLKMYGAHLDITEKKKEEQRVQKLLDLTVKQNDRLKNFAHIVSHNLRSHSTSMSGLLNLIIHETPEIPDNELIDMLVKSSENLNQTVEDLTNVVRASMQDNLVKDIHVCNAIERNIQSLFSQIKGAKILITNNVDRAITVKGIQSYVDSIFLNFISNAIKYKSNERESYLKIHAESNSTHIIIYFEDNGQGIDLEKHGHKLFGMYKTFHKHDDSRGVGLFITKSQVESLGGHIEVTSTVNKGTTFKVFLPY